MNMDLTHAQYNLTKDEASWLLSFLSITPITGLENITMAANIIQYLSTYLEMPAEPPPWDAQDHQPLIDALQTELVNKLGAKWPDFPVKMDAIEGGRIEWNDKGIEELVFNIVVIMGPMMNSIPMRVKLDQRDFTEEFDAVVNLIQCEIDQARRHKDE